MNRPCLLSHLEALNALTMEYRAIMSDPARYNSEEWYENRAKRQSVVEALHEFGLDSRLQLAERRIASLPSGLHGYASEQPIIGTAPLSPELATVEYLPIVEARPVPVAA